LIYVIIQINLCFTNCTVWFSIWYIFLTCPLFLVSGKKLCNHHGDSNIHFFHFTTSKLTCLRRHKTYSSQHLHHSLPSLYWSCPYSPIISSICVHIRRPGRYSYSVLKQQAKDQECVFFFTGRIVYLRLVNGKQVSS
jgi:hypothetical protein